MENQVVSASKNLLRLFEQLKPEAKGKVLVSSPLSVYLCLALLGEGLTGNSFSQLKQVFGYKDHPQVVPGQIQQALKALTSAANSGVLVAISNSVYSAHDYPLKAAWIETLKDVYGSHAETVNFGDAATLPKINGRITEATHGVLKNTIQKLDSNTASVLVNTIYFKGNWAVSFDPKETKKGSFTKSDGSSIQVDFLRKNGSKFALHTGANAEYLAIPYAGENVFFIVELFNSKKIDNSSVEDVLQAANNPNRFNVNIKIPKFKAESRLDLIPVLKSLGVSGIFGASADFANISDAPLMVSQVIHQAFIQVDEVGTEAAAATVAVMSRCMPEVFEAHTPFAFHIVDRKSQLVLFSGAVDSPSF